ncbi:MAG: DUF72 domain-containing protein [Gammaproteobacteria bacterium]|nr:MAG: DUF72 domain-containing protein [Gammaproteobacteria bacterium]
MRVGISGWRYAPWRSTFYPKGLIQKHELNFASRTINTIEINGSFYRLQTPKSYLDWYADTPDNFMFSVKAYQEITHFKRLRNIDKPLTDFFASGFLELKDKLGPILWQFPPSFKFDKELFENFLNLLPENFGSARTFAEKSTRYIESDHIKFNPRKKMRYAVEIRNQSFVNKDFIHLLKNAGVALVVADTAGRWPQFEDITSDFIYTRLHGDKELYRSGYSDEALDYWFKRMKAWREGDQPQDAKLILPGNSTTVGRRDIYCYFDNTDKLWAPYDARKILEKFDLTSDLEETPGKLSEKYQRKNKPKRDIEDGDLSN